MAPTLLIGNKNYSSWSLRPWIAMKVAGIDFDEQIVPLYEPGSRETVLKYSPTGKVPCLVDDDVTVWESLAILDYLADRYPEKKLWPADLKARALARAIAAEMHAGFAALRKHCPMNMRRDPRKIRELAPEVQADVARIDAIWTDCRGRFGQGGPFLFGAFGNADAMYAPVVSRFASYAIPVGKAARAYMEAVMALPAWKDWEKDGRAERWVMPGNEV
ncbi:MAG: glutathione S-transferase family protein [Pseudorhodoplanes sp.]|nr:MAG: glutathione S-transferase family protein [Pseudorhodoplanes sp.]